jgi:hypothetical protein
MYKSKSLSTSSNIFDFDIKKTLLASFIGKLLLQMLLVKPLRRKI